MNTTDKTVIPALLRREWDRLEEVARLARLDAEIRRMDAQRKEPRLP